MASGPIRALVASLALSLIVSACGQSAPSGGAPAAAATPAPLTPIAGGTMTIRLPGDWVTLDIQGAVEQNGNQVGFATYDRLVARELNGKIVPYVAKSWTATATEAVFTLRDDVTCSDGTKMTPTVVADSFKRLFTSGPSSLVRALGPGPYTVTPNDAAGTLSIKLGTPNSDMIAGFATQVGGIICPAGIKTPAMLANGAAGSGAYTIKSATRGDGVVLELRKDWKWGPNGTTAATLGLPEQITFKVMTNDTTAANLLLTGGLDVAMINGPDIPRLEADKSLMAKDSPGFGTYPLIFNQRAGRVTADEKVREAIMTAIDPKGWAIAAFAGRGNVSPSIVSQTVACFDPSTAALVPAPSNDKAQTLLKEAGWTLTNGKFTKDGKPLTLTLPASQSNMPRSATEFLQATLDKMGATVAVQDTDMPTFLVALRGGNFDIVVVPATNGGFQISGAIPTFTGDLYPKGTNYGAINDPILETAKTAALNAAPGDCSQWNIVQQQLLKKKHYMPLASPVYAWFGKGVDFVTAGPFFEPWTLRRVK